MTFEYPVPYIIERVLDKAREYNGPCQNYTLLGDKEEREAAIKAIAANLVQGKSPINVKIVDQWQTRYRGWGGIAQDVLNASDQNTVEVQGDDFATISCLYNEEMLKRYNNREKKTLVVLNDADEFVDRYFYSQNKSDTPFRAMFFDGHETRFFMVGFILLATQAVDGHPGNALFGATYKLCLSEESERRANMERKAGLWRRGSPRLRRHNNQ